MKDLDGNASNLYISYAATDGWIVPWRESYGRNSGGPNAFSSLELKYVHLCYSLTVLNGPRGGKKHESKVEVLLSPCLKLGVSLNLEILDFIR